MNRKTHTKKLGHLTVKRKGDLGLVEEFLSSFSNL